MATATINGAEIAYDDTGGDGPPVILAHGFLPTDDLVSTVAGLIVGDPALSVEWIAKWKARPQESLRQPGTTLLTRDSVWDRLGEITAPALVVHGSADASIPLDHAERLVAGLPHAVPLVAVEGGTHAANLTHPEEVNAAMVPFLADLRG